VSKHRSIKQQFTEKGHQFRVKIGQGTVKGTAHGSTLFRYAVEETATKGAYPEGNGRDENRLVLKAGLQRGSVGNRTNVDTAAAQGGEKESKIEGNMKDDEGVRAMVKASKVRVVRGSGDERRWGFKNGGTLCLGTATTRVNSSENQISSSSLDPVFLKTRFG